jgi:hypothetical protein
MAVEWSETALSLIYLLMLQNQDGLAAATGSY